MPTDTGTQRARELLRRLMREKDLKQREIAKLLRISQSHVSDVLNGKTDAGDKLKAALVRHYPGEALALHGAAEPIAAAPMSARYSDPVTESRDRAERAYLDLHPEADRTIVRETFDWILLQNEDQDQPRDADWWFDEFRKMFGRRIRLLEQRAATTPDEH